MMSDKLKIITSFSALMLYASELGKAKKSGDEEWIKRAQKKHDEYRDLCLQSDKMIIPLER
jgi:hypothetical protein